jgi:branched-chain amino acid transport system substrate-binding protein
MAEYLAPKLGKKPDQVKLALVYEDSLFGTTQAKFGYEAAKKRGMIVIADIPYSAKSTDLTPVILRLKAAKPDFLLYPGYLTDQLLFVRQSKELEFDYKIALTTGGSGLKDFGKALGDDVEGVGLVGFTSMDVNPKFAKGVKEFAALHIKLLGKEADGPYPLMNYMGTKTLFQAIQKGGSTEPEAIRKGALSIDIPHEGTETGGGVQFDPKTGQNLRAITPVAQWQHQQMLTVWPENAAISKIIFPLPTWAERKKK